MKLDALTPTELDCYENWNCADHEGGDCQDIGYSWCAFDDDRIIIVENDQGFVDANTYEQTESGESDYREQVAEFESKDQAFYAEEEQC